MTATEPTRKYLAHPKWKGRVGDYQRRAQQVLVLETGIVYVPWARVETTCQTPMCLTPECMVLLLPKRLGYPNGVCVYCGDPAGAMDHLIPRAWSGETQRRNVVVVPACSDCNCRISDTWAVSINERRQVAHSRIRKKHKRLLAENDTSQSEMDLYAHTLRSAAMARNSKREHVRLRLAWPSDPNYDRRAFEIAGLYDAETLGLM